MKISIIVPVYKAEAYIHRCIDSILGQTFQDFDLLLVDDGSPDNCGAICDMYAKKDSRVHVIHQQNAGVSVARNVGIEWSIDNSDSQWIAFVDSDDWLHKQFLEILITAAEHNGAQLATTPVKTMDTFCEDCLLNEPTYELLEPEESIVRYDCMGTTCCSKLIFKPLLKELRFPVGTRYEDACVAHILTLSANCVAMCWEPLYYYYNNPDSFTRANWTEGRLVALTVHQQRLAYFLENGYKKAYGKEQELYMEDLVQNLQALMWLRKEDVLYEKNFNKVREILINELHKRREEGSITLRKETMWAFFFAASTDVWWKSAKVAQRIYHKLK